MTTNRFSSQPVIPTNVKAVGDCLRPSATFGESSGTPAKVERFRHIYVMERNIIQRWLDPERQGDYQPNRRLSGDTVGLSLEDKPPHDVWQKMYDDLVRALPVGLTPETYVRVLFWLLRNGTSAVPGPAQLLNKPYLTRVMEFWGNRDSLLEVSLLIQVRRINTDMIVFVNGYGWSKLRAIYQLLVDPHNGLSPLFRYSLARNTIGSVSSVDLTVGDTKYIRLIDKTAVRYQILAVLDYSVLPDVYDGVWAETLPVGIKEDAKKAVSDAVKRFN